jgi:DNA-binding IclR family transcriptional regulator
VALAADPTARVRDLADRLGLSESSVARAVAGLTRAGYLTSRRAGRRNRYTVHARQPLRHPLEAHRTVRDLLALGPGGGPGPA